MTIGIEAQRANHPNPTGVEHYSKQLILALAGIDRENEYILYLRTAPQQWIIGLPKNFKYKILGYGPIPFPYAWTQLRLSWEMIVASPDVLFVPAASLPIIHPKNSVITVHDLAWVLYPETYGKLRLLHLKFSNWLGVRFAKRIIAVSKQTKTDLIKKYSLHPEKIIVIYHGFDKSELAESPEKENPESQESEVVGSSVSALARQSNGEGSGQLRQLPKKFILYLSTLQPRKNVTGLIDAFLKLKSEDAIGHSLVLVGGKGWLNTYEEVMRKIKNHPEIIYLGYVPDRFAVLRKADLLVQPALYEGFGLSILDAFACGVPVACSNVSSLPEVAGEAAIYFDPKKIQDMANAIRMAVTDRGLHDALVEKGTERLRHFSWEKCAKETLVALELIRGE